MRLQHLQAVTLVILIVGNNTLSALGIPSLLRPKEKEVVSPFISGMVKKWQVSAYVEEKISGDEKTELPDAALKAYPVYKQLAATKTESNKLNAWLKHGVSTYDAWAKLDLNKVPLDEVYKAPAFGTYARYVNVFDDFVIEKMKTGAKHPVIVSRDATPEEMSTRAVVWALAKRSDHYVKLALGLTNLRGEDLTTHVNYRYYEMFLTATKEMKS